MTSIRLPARTLRRRGAAPVAPAHRWHLLHLAGWCFARAMRLVPRRRRFTAATRVASSLATLIRWTEAYRLQRSRRADGAAEAAVFLVLHVLTKHGTVFDPILEMDGYDALAPALAAGNGALLVGPHAALLHLLLRRFHDDGLEPTALSADPHMCVAGTTVPARTLQPSPTFLVATRNLLRRGRLVCGMIDRGEHTPGRTLEFETPNGPLIVAPALLQVAARSGAPVLFIEVHMDGSRAAGTMRLATSDTTEGLTREFVEFVRAHVSSRAASDEPPAARGAEAR